MKLRTHKTAFQNRQHGLTIVAVLVLLVMLIIFIGTLVWVIIRAIERCLPPPDKAAIIQQLVAEEVAAIQAANPGSTVTVQSVTASYVEVPAFVPFQPISESIIVERSTNLEDWETIAALLPGDTFVDTNPPPDRAFYRRTVR